MMQRNLNSGAFDGGSEPERIAFLVMPEFPLYALVPAIEALRLANQNSGARLYDWQLLSVDGRPVTAGSGMQLAVGAGISDIAFVPTVVVCAGNHPLQHCDKRLASWLRRLDRHGAALGALDTGAFILAEAGLLRGYTITLHFEVIPLFRELYPDIEVREQLFTVDRHRMTCAGGHATLDLMLHLIRNRHGTGLAQIVANGFVSPTMRAETDAQRFALRSRGDDTSLIVRIVRAMEQDLAAPLRAAEVAAAVGIDERTLYRVFHEAVGEPPMRYYLKLRLQAARNVLFYTDTPIRVIAERHGFSCLEVFSRSFKSQFGVCPRGFRRSFSREQLKRFRPELDQPLALTDRKMSQALA
jgi:AraC family transcriptional regulator, carnitine catabolism transcriptional activator